MYCRLPLSQVQELALEIGVLTILKEKAREAEETVNKMKSVFSEIQNDFFFKPDDESHRASLDLLRFFQEKNLDEPSRELKKWRYLIFLYGPKSRSGEREFKEKILLAKQVPIEQLMSVPCKQRSEQRETYLCPFHTEKTPSFVVFKKDNHFYCFGCNTGGDSIEFFMRTMDCDFKQAVDRMSKIST